MPSSRRQTWSSSEKCAPSWAASTARRGLELGSNFPTGGRRGGRRSSGARGGGPGCCSGGVGGGGGRWTKGGRRRGKRRPGGFLAERNRHNSLSRSDP